MILAIAGLALVWLWIPAPLDRQLSVMKTMGILILTLGPQAVWYFGFSGAPRLQRLRVAVPVILVGIALIAAFRMEGLGGDFVPHFVWRWSTEETGTGTTPGKAERSPGADYGQFLGPDRNATLPDLIPRRLEHPPSPRNLASTGRARLVRIRSHRATRPHPGAAGPP